MKLLRAALVSIALTLVSQAVMAGHERIVYVNGVRLTPAQIAWFDRVQCTMIPNGAYWLVPQTGAWGYARNARVQGYLGDLCRSGGNGRRKSLSERGLLYTPGDLNFR